MRKIRWVIAHEPVDLFLRAAEELRTELALANAGIDLEILSLTEYGDKYQGGRKVTKHDVLDLMKRGEIEMSQMYSTTLGHEYFDLFVLDLPFLFASHEHATRVLDGEIGQDLLDNLSELTAFKGLAFTYSGGFRCLPAKRILKSAEDFQGMKVRVSSSPIAEAFFKQLGAEPVQIDLEKMNEAADQGFIDAGESTHVRILPLKQDKSFPFINDTGHSLFLTAMLTTNAFWNSLTPDQQTALQKAAKKVATGEREHAVKVVEEVRKQLGERVMDIDPDKLDELRYQGELATRRFHWLFSDNYVEEIDKLR